MVPDQGIVPCFTLLSRKEQGRRVRAPRPFLPGKIRLSNGLIYNRRRIIGRGEQKYQGRLFPCSARKLGRKGRNGGTAGHAPAGMQPGSESIRQRIRPELRRAVDSDKPNRLDGFSEVHAGARRSCRGQQERSPHRSKLTVVRANSPIFVSMRRSDNVSKLAGVPRPQPPAAPAMPALRLGKECVYFVSCET